MASTDASGTKHRRKLGLVSGMVIAVSIGAATIAVADSTGPRGTPRTAHPTHQSELASWADANGLTGMSPAGLASAPDRLTYVDQSVVTSWAEAKGLTGMSPASLAPVPDRFATVDQSVVAAWAIAN
jgi:hypothetical protein